MLLSLIIFLPLVGGCLLLFVPRDNIRAIKQVALLVAVGDTVDVGVVIDNFSALTGAMPDVNINL